uniref:Uncharacterized protein n=1 Tax=Arundo donax TaxID=35708 RepID=A0A0A8Y7C4_ARUDO
MCFPSSLTIPLSRFFDASLSRRTAAPLLSRASPSLSVATPASPPHPRLLAPLPLTAWPPQIDHSHHPLPNRPLLPPLSRLAAAALGLGGPFPSCSSSVPPPPSLLLLFWQGNADPQVF